MKPSSSKRRFSTQDLTVIIALGFITILGFGAITQTQIVTTLVIAGFFAAALILYGLWPVKENLEPLSQDYISPSENESLAAQARLADGFPEAMAIIDTRHRVIYANPAAKTLLDIKNLGRPLSTYVRELGVTDMIERALSGARPEPFTYKIDLPTERHIRLMASSFKTSDVDFPKPMALCIFSDMTEYMFIDGQRADFLANASHELKTPVASILGYIETLQGHAKDDAKAREKFLTIMKNQGERMQRLISDLLSLLRIEQIEHQAPDGKADMKASLITAIEAVEPTSTKRNIKINFEPGLIPPVRGDQDELIQLVLNLLDNAARISQPGTEIDLSLSVDSNWQLGPAFADSIFSSDAQSRRIVLPPSSQDTYIIFKIRDYGPGFSRDHLPRIGERFYRIAGDLSSKDKGTGLGLAIVKHITRRHRGGLLIKSGTGEGTEFVVMLPPYETADEID